MKVIYDAKVIDTDDKDNYHRLQRMDPLQPVALWEDPDTLKCVSVYTETLKGRKFRNPKTGMSVTVALDEKTQQALGLMYDTYDNMEVAIGMLRQDRSDLHDMLDRLYIKVNRSTWRIIADRVKRFWSNLWEEDGLR